MAIGGLLHGVIWKLAALLSKLGVIVAIAPHLADGQFVQYLFIVSCTQLVSRVLSWGAEDQLPLVIRQSPPESQYSSTAILTLGLSIITFGLALLMPLDGWLYVIATLAFFTTSYVSGIVRHISPSSFEQLHNAPGIIFFALILLFRLPDARQLILVQVLTNLIVNVWIIARHRDYFRLSSSWFRDLSLYYRRAKYAGLQKMFSSFSQLLLMRGFIVIPPLFGLVPTDALAFAVSIAEGFWQILVVLSARNYVKYLKKTSVDALVIFRNSSLFYFAATMFTFVGILGALKLGLDQTINLQGRIDYVLTAGMVLFYGSLVPILESRYLAWAQEQSPYKHTLMFIVLTLPMAIVINLLPQESWTLYYGCFFLVFASLFVLREIAHKRTKN